MYIGISIFSFQSLLGVMHFHICLFLTECASVYTWVDLESMGSYPGCRPEGALLIVGAQDHVAPPTHRHHLIHQQRRHSEHNIERKKGAEKDGRMGKERKKKWRNTLNPNQSGMPADSKGGTCWFLKTN